MSRILIVEDEQHIAAGLQFNLVAEHHDAEVVTREKRRWRSFWPIPLASTWSSSMSCCQA
jgi:DNA-binding response OmpR family regulator